MRGWDGPDCANGKEIIMKRLKRRVTPVGVLVSGKSREGAGIADLRTLEFAVAVLRYKRMRTVRLVELWQIVTQLKDLDEAKRPH